VCPFLYEFAATAICTRQAVPRINRRLVKAARLCSLDLIGNTIKMLEGHFVIREPLISDRGAQIFCVGAVFKVALERLSGCGAVSMTPVRLYYQLATRSLDLELH
jgi:hypothetical protein